MKNQSRPMYRFWAYLIFCALAPSIYSFGQSQQQINSITAELASHPDEDTARVNILNRLSYAYWNNDPIKTDSLARQSLSLAEKLDYVAGQGEAWRCVLSVGGCEVNMMKLLKQPPIP